MRRFRFVLFPLFLSSLFLACAHTAPAQKKDGDFSLKDLNEQLVMATLWVQTSAEYRALCYQAYNVAREVLDRDLKEHKTQKRRAVIVDGDETTIQANAYEASLVGREAEYPTEWYDWVASASGPAIPGAVEFLTYAASKGVETFYVTNRKVDLEGQGTFDNLKRQGFPFVDKEHVIFRQKGMNDDKEPRQRALAEKYHIVLYVGDNLDDFPGGFWQQGVDERFGVTDSARNAFGERFIVLPNPMYGGWEKAVRRFEKNLSAAEQDRRRKSALRRWKK